MQSWDNHWESVYVQQGFRAKYPDEFVIRFVAVRFFRLSFAQRKAVRILDIGCGPGRHVVFLAREGFSAHGIEAASSALALCRESLAREGLEASVQLADFIRLPYPDDYFDAVIDCASIQHNLRSAIAQTYNEIRRVLKPKAEVFSLLRTDRDYTLGTGRMLEPGTYTDFRGCDLEGVGHTHFLCEKDLVEFLSEYQEFDYEYTERTIDSRSKSITHWLVMARK
jgi:SAM-dependent methyltransferase